MAMQNIEPLILDLVEWVDKKPRTYADVMEAWKTSCPRLTVWEDTIDAGYVVREHDETKVQRIVVTPTGQQLLNDHRPSPIHS